MAKRHIVGCILGTAIGDAIGLPYEGLSRRRAARLLGPPKRHRLLFGRGMISDDTEHTCMVALALIDSQDDPELFARSLAWRLRLWLVSMPAGIGMATLRSILRLWMGYSASHSGVYSAGNGPAMRSAVLGASLDDPLLLRKFVRASTRITHVDPKAEYGAYAVALAAQMVRTQSEITSQVYLERLSLSLQGEGGELLSLLEAAAKSAEMGQSTVNFANSLGLTTGVTGYVYHSVPVALHAWFRHSKNFPAAIEAVILCGGDADTTAAIVGGIVGVGVGKQGIPVDWLNSMMEWPRSIRWMENLAGQLTEHLEEVAGSAPVGNLRMRLPVLGLLFRNMLFLLVVLYHGLRRLLPPY